MKLRTTDCPIAVFPFSSACRSIPNFFNRIAPLHEVFQIEALRAYGASFDTDVIVIP